MHFIVSLLFFSLSSFCKVAPFLPKHSIQNLKAFDEDLDSSFIQTTQNSLVFSHGLKKKTLFKEQADQQFQIFNNNKNWVLIERSADFIEDINFRKKNEYFIATTDAQKLQKIGDGNFGQIHANGKYISLINFQRDSIDIYSTFTKKRVKLISRNSRKNPLSIPQVKITQSGDIFYTLKDQSNRDVLYYVSSKNKKTKLYTTKNPTHHLKTCLDSKENLFVKVSHIQSSDKSRSFILDSSLQPLYSTSSKLAGNIICLGNKVYFVQENEVISELHPKRFSTLEFDLEKNEVLKIFEKDSFIHMIQQGGKVYFLSEGKYYKLL